MNIDLDAIHARADAATPGPWTLRDGWGPAGDGLMRFTRIANDEHHTVLGLIYPGEDIVAPLADAEFIAHARQDIPALLAEIDRLTAALPTADRIAQAIGDPGSIVGNRIHTSFGDDHDETITRWSTRAVLAVLSGGAS